MNKCKKHNKKLLKCTNDHYGEPCDCIDQCEVCVRVRKKEHEKQMKKCNLVMEIDINWPSKSLAQRRVLSFKPKPRNRLKKGDYATLDMKTGYLVKAKGIDCKFFVVE